MNETYILNLPSGAVSYNPSSFDFVSFADKNYISATSPVLTATDKVYRTPDEKTYLECNFILRDQDDNIVGNSTAYRVFDNTLALIEYINPPFEKTESSCRVTKEKKGSHLNTTTEDILNWALNTYNYKNPNERIFSLEEAREMLFNGTISYYFDMVVDNDKSEIKEIPCIYIEGDNIWTKDLPNLTHTSSNISLTENTTIKHIEGIFSNIVTGDYLSTTHLSWNPFVQIHSQNSRAEDICSPVVLPLSASIFPLYHNIRIICSLIVLLSPS